ncbi:MAG: TetR/AcrR family transcriptional regulator [Ruminococcus sp.]|nr:TetR/AcrR family transcriptional regulator [Ruminococcus sp.]
MGKSETTRQEIMRITKDLILEKGYAQVTMNDVTRASGMSAGGLYYHYRTVEEIVKDILRTETDMVWENIGRPENTDELMTAVRTYFQSEKHELLDYKDSLNWVLYEYYFSFPREQRETLLKQQHEQTAALLRDILGSFIVGAELDMLINDICVTLLGLTMFSMTGMADEITIDSSFDRLKTEIEQKIHKGKD